MDLRKTQELVTRSLVTDFLSAMGIDPNDVAEIRIYPNRLILTRYLNNPDGSRMLDHLGPKTAETYFNID